MANVSIRAVRDVAIPHAHSGRSADPTRTLRSGDTASVAPEIARQLFRSGDAVPAELHYCAPISQHVPK